MVVGGNRWAVILFGGILPGGGRSLGEGIDGIGHKSLGEAGDKGPDDGLGRIQIGGWGDHSQQRLQGDIGVPHVLKLGKKVALQQAADKEPVGDKAENAGKQQGDIKLCHDHAGLADPCDGIAVVQLGEAVIVVDDSPH